MPVAGLVAAAGAYGPLALAVAMFIAMARAWFRGDLVPRSVVASISEAWKAADALREAARKEERDQLISLMAELREALRHHSRAVDGGGS